MNLARINGASKVARIAAEQHLADLEAIYTSVIVQAGRVAAQNFVASQTVTLTADAGDPPDWQPPPEGVLLPLGSFLAKAQQKLAKLHRMILTATAKPPLARAGIAWDITHPLSQQLLDATGARTGERLGNTVQPVLQKIVGEAYAQGLPVPDAADLIRAQIGEAAPGQAQMLARTDLNSLSNGGSQMAAEMIGVGYKQWLTAEDDRVRETHAEADGQIVPIDQPFDVGGEALDYPGDPSGSDEEVCNCRCTLIYVDGPDVQAETASAGRIPTRGFAMASPQMPDAPSHMPSWESDIAFEGAATSDGRYILPGALSWRDLPLTLGVMYDTPHADVVMSAPVCGRIETMDLQGTNMDGDKMPSGMMACHATGIFDAGEDGMNCARMVGEETMRGISIDMAVDDWCFRDPTTGNLMEPDAMGPEEMDAAMFGELQYAVRAGTIMAATVCPTPAFADARIALTASADGRRVVRLTSSLRLAGTEPLTASAAGLAPSRPPAEWFRTPEPDKPTPLTVTKDGRVFGHMALWDSCHVGFPGQCVPPPRSSSGYAYFNLGEVECADGTRVAAGAITLEALHADKRLSAEQAQAHYLEHTGMVGAYVRAVDGNLGIWVSGALRASLPERYARDLMGAKPSGDWRQTRPGGPLEMIGVHAVNEPGFPVPRLVASALLPSGMRAELVFAEPEPSGRVPARGFARV